MHNVVILALRAVPCRVPEIRRDSGPDMGLRLPAAGVRPGPTQLANPHPRPTGGPKGKSTPGKRRVLHVEIEPREEEGARPANLC